MTVRDTFKSIVDQITGSFIDEGEETEGIIPPYETEGVLALDNNTKQNTL